MLEPLLSDGWSYHDTESERLAAELEAAAEAPIPADQADAFLRLSNHTLGEHLGDWGRARRLADRILAGGGPALAKAWLSASVARLMDGDAVASCEAELTGLAAAGEDFRPALVEARFMLVAALVGSGRARQAKPLYEAALALSGGLADAAPTRAIAVASNNLASELLESSSRGADEDALMRMAAQAALDHWRRCGTWENEERALYLNALVANALGEPRKALADANAGLDVIAANGEEPVDKVFLRLERARALGALGDAEGQARELQAADAATAGWIDEALKASYATDRARAVAR